MTLKNCLKHFEIITRLLLIMSVRNASAKERYMQCVFPSYRKPIYRGSSTLKFIVDSSKWKTSRTTNHCVVNIINYDKSRENLSWEVIEYADDNKCLENIHCKCQASIYATKTAITWHGTRLSDQQCLSERAVGFIRIQNVGDSGSTSDGLGISIVVEQFDKRSHLYVVIMFTVDTGTVDRQYGISYIILIIVGVSGGILIVVGLVAIVVMYKHERLQRQTTRAAANAPRDSGASPLHGEHLEYPLGISTDGRYLEFPPQLSQPVTPPEYTSRDTLAGQHAGGYYPHNVMSRTENPPEYSSQDTLVGLHPGYRTRNYTRPAERRQMYSNREASLSGGEIHTQDHSSEQYQSYTDEPPPPYSCSHHTRQPSSARRRNNEERDTSHLDN